MKVTRYYICDACDHNFVIEQERDAPLKKKCPECKKLKLYQDLAGIHCNVVQEATSVQQLAERNTKNAGGYELDKIRHEANKQKKGRKEGPWYNKGNADLTKELANIDTNEKATKYIMEGKK